jgi:polysaccharide deacetylase 2 family uncharacterized protein YibQ
MRLKTISIVFLTTVLLLALLIGLRNGSIKRIVNSVTSTSRSILQNNSHQNSENQKTSLEIEKLLVERLEELETPRSQLSIHHLLEDSTIEIKGTVPRGKPMEWIIWYICSPLRSTGYHVADCIYRENPSRCSIRLESTKKKRPAVRIILSQSKRFFSSSAKMAVVIADFGFKANATTVEFLSFPEPLTVSLVSTKKMSTWTAQIANEYRKEIVILLPMEPLTSSFRHYRNEALLIHYSPERIRALLTSATESIPYFAGFSNLCGARVLSDSRMMNIILTKLKKDHGYFLIDPVSRKSVASSVARSLKVPYRTIEISLDSTASAGSSLADTLHHAAMIAHKTGSVVIQVKATEQFLKTLKSQLSYLHHNGIRLVYLSEIVHHPGEQE